MTDTVVCWTSELIRELEVSVLIDVYEVTTKVISVNLLHS